MIIEKAEDLILHNEGEGDVPDQINGFSWEFLNEIETRLNIEIRKQIKSKASYAHVHFERSLEDLTGELVIDFRVEIMITIEAYWKYMCVVHMFDNEGIEMFRFPIACAKPGQTVGNVVRTILTRTPLAYFYVKQSQPQTQNA